MSFAGLTNQTLTIQRATVNRNVVGAPERTWTALSGATSVPARVETLDATEAILAGREGTRDTERAFFKTSATITTADRATHSGNTYDILSVNPQRGASGSIHHIEMIMELLT